MSYSQIISLIYIRFSCNPGIKHFSILGEITRKINIIIYYDKIAIIIQLIILRDDNISIKPYDNHIKTKMFSKNIFANKRNH